MADALLPDTRKCPRSACAGEMVVRAKRRTSKDGSLDLEGLWICPRCGCEEWHRLPWPYKHAG